MNKQEFETIMHLTKVGTPPPTQEEYKLIEFVYNFHPAINEVTGKKQVAWLWCEFGLSIFNDMHPKAIKAEKLERELLLARDTVTILEEKLRVLKEGEHALSF